MQSGDALEDIKQRLTLEEVAGEYIELKRAGRNLKALSPFGNEKTPSFMVSPEKQIWHDFSSGKGGNMFSLVMELEGVDFKGALEILARKAGIDLANYGRRSGSNNGRNKNRLLEALALAVKYYQQSLLKSPEAIDYLTKKRHFNKAMIMEFGIGYAPNAQKGLVTALLKRGYNQQEIKQAGLGTERYSGFSDMFRGRIMIPLTDPQGAPIGFTARLLHDDPNSPKYINTPQTLLYDKSRHVFGLAEAKQAIRLNGYVVMVEGNLDVIKSHQIDVKQVVATAGTALTELHLRTLSRFTEDIRIAFDQDNAGLKATERAIQIAIKAGIKLSVIDVPEGKDPDELIVKNPELWRSVIEEPIYSIDWLRQRYLNFNDISTALGKKAYSDAMIQIIGLISDPVEQEHYLMTLATDLSISFDAVSGRFRQLNVKKNVNTKKELQINQVSNSEVDNYAYQDHLLALLVAHPITRRILESQDEEPIFSTPERQFVFEFVSLNPYEVINDTPEDLQNVSDYVKILLLMAEELYSAFDNNERLREAHDLLRRLQKDYKKTEMHKLSTAIREAEGRGDVDAVSDLLAKFNNIIGKTKE